MTTSFRRTLHAIALLACAALLIAQVIAQAQLQPALKTRRVVWVMTDGMRWQEIFAGADAGLITDALRKDFWRETAEERRSLVMPFLWSTVAKNGQIYGNRALGSEASVTNGLNFSYPGYNESLTGFADPRIDSNDKKYNPNTTVLEWLHGKPAYRGKVAAFGAWDLFPWIFNAPRAGFTVNAGFEPLTGFPGNPTIQLLNELKADSPHDWDDEVYDNLTFHTAMEYLRQRKPRVMFLSLGETDDWAHAGKYGEYLRSARRADRDIQALWETLQAMPEYRGVTTLIISTDHGRGDGEAWKSHGVKVPESKNIWMAFMGPDTPALGERKLVAAVTQSQIAATLAALLGEDYHGAVPTSGAVIADVLPKVGGKF